MKVTINCEEGLKTFHFRPQIVTRRSAPRDHGVTEHSITLRDMNYCVAAFCRSKKSSNNLAREIGQGTCPELSVGEACLAICILVHPPGWPESRGPEFHLATADEESSLVAGAYAPEKERDVFSRTPTAAFSVVPTLPDAPYRYIRYKDVLEIWMKDERVGMRFDPRKMDSGLARINIVMESRQAAFDLDNNLKRQNVRVLRVNRSVRAVFHELDAAPNETTLLIDGLSNLRDKQQRALASIGITLLPNGCHMSGVLQWHHVRLLAAMRLF